MVVLHLLYREQWTPWSVLYPLSRATSIFMPLQASILVRANFKIFCGSLATIQKTLLLSLPASTLVYCHILDKYATVSAHLPLTI